ncbi:MAG TPA: type I restriction endonuclease [Longimicrobium sp.]|nr:type I restriction endonuclease [Longimicrobium sp.]
MSQDFRAALVAHAQVALDRAGRAQSEAATQQYLIIPFIQLLGYDPLDPDEVIPEAHASFSDKFKNRVDYAICQNGQPVIAIECKKVGTLNEANRGELKGYFNAVPTVKLGILTDGLNYQLYTDTGLENMMDDEPFAVIDLNEVAREQVRDTELDALSRLRKGTFDPANVGADARRKIYLGTYVEVLNRTLSEPDERFVRTLLDMANIDGRRTTRMIEEHTPIVRDAAQALLDRLILARVGFADRKDLVKVPSEAAAATPPAAEAPPAEAAPGESGVVTTETELEVFDYVRRRLPFLIAGDEELYQRLNHLRPVDYKTVFSVYYKQERKGKLFNFWEGKEPRYRFEFVALGAGNQIQTDNLSDIDASLLASFRQRVQELG